MTGSMLIHVQHLLGIGHLQRARRIGEALARHGAAVTLVSGGSPVPGWTPPDGVRFVQLPPIRSLDARFALVDSDGQPVDDDLRAARRGSVLHAFAAARPDVVVVEGFPFARRAFRFELDPLIAAARQAGTSLVCSVRDIVNMRDDPARHAETVARVRADFAAVLVHGDPSLIPFEASFPAAAEIADRLHYTGYVVESPLPDPPLPGLDPGIAGKEEILVSAGGGPAGMTLLRIALAARGLGCLADRPWRVLAGGGVPEAEFAALAGMAPAGVAVERFRVDFPALLRRCHISVSQAGYNTVLDVLTARKRAVLVPFAAEREREQLVRAERLAALGAVQMLRESELSPPRLGEAIERASCGAPPALEIDVNGAECSARLIAGLIRGGSNGSGVSPVPPQRL